MKVIVGCADPFLNLILTMGFLFFKCQAPQPVHVVQQQRSHHSGQQHAADKNETAHLSPVKKRVKESSPPQNEQYRRRHSPQNWQHYQHQQASGSSGSGNNGSNRQPTITIEDTPSPAVSVITISDSDEEGNLANRSSRPRNGTQPRGRAVKQNC